MSIDTQIHLFPVVEGVFAAQCQWNSIAHGTGHRPHRRGVGLPVAIEGQAEYVRGVVHHRLLMKRQQIQAGVQGLMRIDVDLERVSSRLDYAGEKNLPLTEAQRQALHTFALAYFHDALSSTAGSMAALILNWGTLAPFGTHHADLLAVWRAHPLGAVRLAEDLLANGQVPAEWPHAEVVPWLEAALAVASGDHADSLVSALHHLIS